MPSYEGLRTHALEMLREESVQDKLASLVASYLAIVQPIIIEATVQKAGIRPAGLENEIYSCFHHIARGLCESTTKEEAEREIDKGENTHLKRVLLDSYKIAVNPSLQEYQFVVEDLYQLSLDKDFNPDIYGADPVRKIWDILRIKTAIKEAYQTAKHNEVLGNTEKTIEAYERALRECGNLRKALNSLMKRDVYIVAKAHAARKQAERDAERKESWLNNRVTWIIAILALVVAACAWLFPRGCETKDSSSSRQTPASSVSPTGIVNS